MQNETIYYFSELWIVYFLLQSAEGLPKKYCDGFLTSLVGSANMKFSEVHHFIVTETLHIITYKRAFTVQWGTEQSDCLGYWLTSTSDFGYS